jgi:hypothetical protein
MAAKDRHPFHPLFIGRGFCDSIFCLVTHWPFRAYAWCAGSYLTTRIRTLVAQARASRFQVAGCLLVFALLSRCYSCRLHNRGRVGSRQRDNSPCRRVASRTPSWKRFSGDRHQSLVVFIRANRSRCFCSCAMGASHGRYSFNSGLRLRSVGLYAL